MADRRASEHYSVDASGRWRPEESHQKKPSEEAITVLREVEHLDFRARATFLGSTRRACPVRKRTGQGHEARQTSSPMSTWCCAPRADRACELMTLKIDKLGGPEPGGGFLDRKRLGRLPERKPP
jgi:hypothetical protein